jgi:hypothetical protein
MYDSSDEFGHFMSWYTDRLVLVKGDVIVAEVVSSILDITRASSLSRKNEYILSHIFSISPNLTQPT